MPDLRSPRGTVATLLLLGLAACGPRPTGSADSTHARARHLLLLTVDTLRTDRLSTYGGPNPTSPHLDRLAFEGLRFENAHAPRGLTLPSFASIFTSKYPPEHGMLDNTWSLRLEEELLAERLAAAGFRNRAFVANGMLQPLRNNVEQGFSLESYTFDKDEEVITAGAERWLREEFGRTAARDFLWVHWFNPHKPYLPPPGNAEPFLDPDYAGEFDGRASSMKRVYVERIDLAPADLANILGHYDGTLRYVDACMGRLLEALAASGQEADTLVVFAADHGEELYTHNHYFYHGNSVYRTVTSIPLVFRQPGAVPPGRVADELVSALDLLPTLLGWLGVADDSAPGNEPRGRDLSERIAGGPAVPREYVHAFHGDDIHVLRSERWSYVVNPSGRRPDGPPREGVYTIPARALYDLEADPDEQRDVLAAHPEVAARLEEELQRFLASLAPVEPWRGTQEELMLPRLRELAELGYIEAEDVEAYQDAHEVDEE